MDWNRFGNAPGLELNQYQLWDALNDYRHFAAVKLAWDENRNRLLADAAYARVHPGAERGIEPRPLLDGVRNRLGQALIRLGTQLCGTRQPIPAV